MHGSLTALNTTLIAIACSLLVATGTYFLGYDHGSLNAEKTWSEAYRVAADAYIEQSSLDAKASAKRLANAMRKRQESRPLITEAERALDSTPSSAVFSPDELRGLESLHRAHFGSAGSVSGGMRSTSASEEPGEGLRQGPIPMGLRVPEPAQ